MLIMVPLETLFCEMLSHSTHQLAALHTLHTSCLLLNKDWMWKLKELHLYFDAGMCLDMSMTICMLSSCNMPCQ